MLKYRFANASGFDFAENSAGPLTPMSQTPQCYWHQRVRLHSVIGTEESDSIVLLAPMSQTHMVIGTTESDSTVLLAPLSQTPQSY